MTMALVQHAKGERTANSGKPQGLKREARDAETDMQTLAGLSLFEQFFDLKMLLCCALSSRGTCSGHAGQTENRQVLLLQRQ